MPLDKHDAQRLSPSLLDGLWGGVFREVVVPERLANTQIFDQDWTGGEAGGTLTLIERDGKTTMTGTVRYASPEVREAVLKTPMESGLAAGYDRPDNFLETLAHV
ncbi:hypothetical protein BH10PLA2_BH10PLA2_10110 [soil metagenome]